MWPVPIIDEAPSAGWRRGGVFTSETGVLVHSNGNKSNRYDFHERLCMPGNKPSNKSNKRNKSLVFRMSRKLGALISCERGEGFTTRSKRRNKGHHYRNGSKGSLILHMPRKAIVGRSISKGIVTSVSKRGEHRIILGNKQNKLKGRRFTASAVRIPGCTRPKRPTERLRIGLRLGMVTSINLVNFPGINGSALLSHIAGTRPGVTGCRFAALGPGLNIISLSKTGKFIVTSVPKLVRNTSRNMKLKRRFLHRVREAGLVVRIMSTTKARKESPISSVRGVGTRLTTCGPRVTRHPRMVTTGGASLVCSPRSSPIRHLGSRFRPGKVGMFPVSKTAKGKVSSLLCCMDGRLRGLSRGPMMFRRRCFPSSRLVCRSLPCAMRRTSKVCMIRNPGVRGVLKCAGLSSRGKFTFFRGFLGSSNVLTSLRGTNVRRNSAIEVCKLRFSCCGWKRCCSCGAGDLFGEAYGSGKSSFPN